MRPRKLCRQGRAADGQHAATRDTAAVCELARHRCNAARLCGVQVWKRGAAAAVDGSGACARAGALRYGGRPLLCRSDQLARRVCAMAHTARSVSRPWQLLLTGCKSKRGPDVQSPRCVLGVPCNTRHCTGQRTAWTHVRRLCRTNVQPCVPSYDETDDFAEPVGYDDQQHARAGASRAPPPPPPPADSFDYPKLAQACLLGTAIMIIRTLPVTIRTLTVTVCTLAMTIRTPPHLPAARPICSNTVHCVRVRHRPHPLMRDVCCTLGGMHPCGV